MVVVTTLFVAIATKIGELRLFTRTEWTDPFVAVGLVLAGFGLGAWYMWAKRK